MPQRDLSTLQLVASHLQQLRLLLAQTVPEAQVWAYGSRVNGTAHPTSDLDIVLRAPQDLSQAVGGWLDLKHALQNSSLPILVDVHDWAHLPVAFQRNIEAAYVELQAGSAARRVAPPDAQRAGR